MRQPGSVGNYKLRDDQQLIVSKIMAAYDSGKRIVILQAPTGTGKSVIGRTITTAFSSSYIVIPDKKLQTQYETDFLNSGNIASLRGKANYTCTVYDDAPSVDEAPCQFAKKNTQIRECIEEGTCPYYNARSRAIDADHTIFNSAAFLTWLTVSASMEVPYFSKRELHVVDEAHKLEDVVCEYLGIKHFEYQLARMFKSFDMEIPPMPRQGTEEEASTYLLEMQRLAGQALEILIEDHGTGSLAGLLALAMESKKLERQVMPLQGLQEKVTRLFETGIENYALGYGFEAARGTFKGGAYITAKPLYVGNFVRERVLGDFTLFMSATLPMGDIWMKDLGLDPDECEFIDVDSHFPHENRSIFFTPIGKLSRGEDKRRVSEIATKIRQILQRFPDEKGIVHAPSYAFNKLLAAEFEGDSRMLICLSGDDSDPLLQKHMQSTDGTVIVSPAMQEGIDLKDDLSRVQIIVKAPFGNLGDPAILKKMQRNPNWYNLRTLTSTLQMYGRSIRHPKDFARTYILDEDLKTFLQRVQKSVPGYVRDAIRW